MADEGFRTGEWWTTAFRSTVPLPLHPPLPFPIQEATGGRGTMSARVSARRHVQEEDMDKVLSKGIVRSVCLNVPPLDLERALRTLKTTIIYVTGKGKRKDERCSCCCYSWKRHFGNDNRIPVIYSHFSDAPSPVIFRRMFAYSIFFKTKFSPNFSHLD